ncbi:AAHS family 4-hydroxybenzoate transporter-like MFS transporter [Novosphingobium capsulatum]|uniref:AAHS family 4-hydroxybenzoate transporter-like MFS transporter n=1 Tax=Novosphingobium capsulatum TaxID=13688 RepID=A0ABU1MJI5_9SPHN|nr:MULTISPECIES: MFS transporter [Novosphingobium]MBB3358901.1 AAHS family 4-hydroxybenzoate transporter-like MFS transporter [Novosphingobium sp. BK256]MBB3375618.1 AAHS family 4-hydroxybenzoate transporter-like MFS transporter [Novosphingobium sp. BK280]MBB3379673.1 AAHS family 4-hydroxybenzoate transporter-like MFS transporter [Novosphingobium sp. BK258]MBB3421368.1 AAHS family 4-hydroxybenzoate transporter-like MFS transporter [Novosphingobium sp. BK267]MBB3449683.1 AAHS family 4-hydroxybe
MGKASRTIDVARVIDARGLGPFNYRLIALSWLITVFDGFDMMMISFTAPYMRDELGLTKPMLGNVFSAGLLGMMIGGFVLAWLGDRRGRRQTIALAAVAFGILTAATALARSYEALLVLRFLDGFAIGGMLPLAWALNIEYVPTRLRSTVVTVIMMGYSLGTALAGPVTVWLAPRFGWEGVFVAGGTATLAIAAALFVWLPESVRFLVARNRDPVRLAATLNRIDPGLGATASDQFVLGDEARVASGNFRVSQLFTGRLRWITPLLWLGYIASTLAVYFKANWGPIVYEDLHFTRDLAAYVSSFSGLMGAVLGLLLMRFTDRKGALAVAFFPALAAPVLLLIGLVPLSSTAFLVLSVISTSLVGGAHFGILSIAGIYYPTAIRANGSGWATSVAKIGGIAGPILGGMVLASGLPVVTSFAILAICPVVLALAAFGIALVVGREQRATAIANSPAPSLSPTS